MTRQAAWCWAARPPPSSLWRRPLVPYATMTSSGAALRTAGSSASSAIAIETGLISARWGKAPAMAEQLVSMGRTVRRGTRRSMASTAGMTPKGFNKMINYESIFYGVKALLYGIPLSIGVMYLIHRAMMNSFSYDFELPWISLLIVIVAVFFIVGSAMVYASAKVRRERIIDALKQENI